MAENRQTPRDFGSILRAAGNDRCADCKIPITSLDFGCLSTRFGVILCVACGEVHRKVLKHTKIVSLNDQNVSLSEAELSFVASRSNAIVNDSLEKHIEPSYRRSTNNSPNIVKEEFVRAKYERAEFMEPRPESFKETRTTLLKRGKNKDAWKTRWFLLSPRHGVLMYFTKEEQRIPKGRIRLNDMNVTFAAEKCGKSTALQVTYLHNGSTRSLFVAVVDDNPKAAVDWYNAIRHAKLQYLRIAFPTDDDKSLISNSSWSSRSANSNTSLNESQLANQSANGSVLSDVSADASILSASAEGEAASIVKRYGSQPSSFGDSLTHDFEIEGWLVKAPPRRRDAWVRRWFVLDGRKLSYYVAPLDAFAKGEIFVGPLTDGFDLYDGIPDELIDLLELRRIDQLTDARSSTSLESQAVKQSPSNNSLNQNSRSNQNQLSNSSASFDELSRSTDSSKRLSLGMKNTSRSTDELTEQQVKDRSFTLRTPRRTFLLVAPSVPVKVRWLTALASVVCSASQPKDNVTAVTLVPKRRADVRSIVSMLKEKL